MLNWNITSRLSPTIDQNQLNQAISEFRETLFSNPEVGFFNLPQEQDLSLTQKVYEHFKHKKYFVHIGIGGSALGPEMLLSALGNEDHTKFVFLNNIDPDDIEKKLKSLDVRDSLFYIVSKSGTTAETVAAMIIVLNLLNQAGIKEEDYKDFLVFCTDPHKGELRQLSNQWGIKTLEIPSNVGGRFSVLTPCGLLPAYFAGIKVENILLGARDIQKNLADPHLGQDFFKLGFWLKELHDQGIHQTVMMPYSSLLKDFSSWFVQLWAESLGKEGKGLTPIAAYGATDQHSQMQLFMEGPNDKALMIIEIENFKSEFALSNSIQAESFRNLSPFNLSTLMKAELSGSLEALNEKQKPIVHLRIPSLREEFLGQLILFGESLTVFVGQLLGVNPFDQPGVEAGKNYAKQWLKNHQ